MRIYSSVILDFSIMQKVIENVVIFVPLIKENGVKSQLSLLAKGCTKTSYRSVDVRIIVCYLQNR